MKSSSVGRTLRVGKQPLPAPLRKFSFSRHPAVLRWFSKAPSDLEFAATALAPSSSVSVPPGLYRWHTFTGSSKTLSSSSEPTRQAEAGKDGKAKTAAYPFPTLAEADAELHKWICWCVTPAPSLAPTLTGKSLVLCVTSLQLREATTDAPRPEEWAELTGENSSNGVGSGDGLVLVHNYLRALARYTYVHCNARGKPDAARLLIADVEAHRISADALKTSVQYLAHSVFCRSTGALNDEEQDASLNLEMRMAQRDLELTMEATLALLVSLDMTEPRRCVTLGKIVDANIPAACLVPLAESAAYHICNMVKLVAEPLRLSPIEREEREPALLPNMLPRAKQNYWVRTARQLTSVIYVALLVGKANSAEVQSVKQLLRRTLRQVYKVEDGRFGVWNSVHYMCVVVIPYVGRRFSIIANTLQQRKTGMPTPAAGKKKQAKRVSLGKASSTACTGTRSSTSHAVSGTASIPSPHPEKWNKITLVMLCVAAVLYLFSSQTEKPTRRTAALTSPPDSFTASQLIDAEALERNKKEMAQVITTSTATTSKSGWA